MKNHVKTSSKGGTMKSTKNKFTSTQVMNMFNMTVSKNAFFSYEEKGLIPKAERVDRGKTSVRMWSKDDLPIIGEKVGYLKRPVQTQVIPFFTQKGGTGKTPLAFQFARTLALHNIRTLVIGLDSQGTITSILKGYQETDSLPDDIDDLYDDGLFELYRKEINLEEAIQDTDLQTLKFIPENAGLTALEADLNHEANPLGVFEKHLFGPLKESGQFDYIICDCNPSWGRIINSVLVSADLLVSPLKCDASTLATTKTFFSLLAEFEENIDVELEKFVIPTLLENNKLSRQVLSYYETNFSNICAKTPLKKTVTIDEAQILQLSVAEHAPTSPVYGDLVSVFKEITELVEFLNAEETDSPNSSERNESTNLTQTDANI